MFCFVHKNNIIKTSTTSTWRFNIKFRWTLCLWHKDYDVVTFCYLAEDTLSIYFVEILWGLKLGLRLAADVFAGIFGSPKAYAPLSQIWIALIPCLVYSITTFWHVKSCKPKFCYGIWIYLTDYEREFVNSIFDT